MESANKWNDSLKFMVTIIIDVFRAFTTACYVLEQNPASYVITNKCKVVSKLTASDTILIGKPEKGSNLKYDIPNSPLRAQELELKNKHIIHRTEAGATGIMKSKGTILAASFVNANATIQYIKKQNIDNYIILAMGHEANTPSLEDNLCAEYIKKIYNGDEINISKYIPKLRKTSGKYFFGQDQWQYPREDFALCLEKDKFHFAIIAYVKLDWACLTKVFIDKY